MPKMVLLVLDDPSKLDDVLATWYALGLKGVSVLESSGLGRLAVAEGRDDLPLFPGLRHLLREHSEVHHRTLWSTIDDDLDVDALFDATERVVGLLDAPNTGIMVVLPVLAVRGLNRT